MPASAPIESPEFEPTFGLLAFGMVSLGFESGVQSLAQVDAKLEIGAEPMVVSV